MFEKRTRGGGWRPDAGEAGQHTSISESPTLISLANTIQVNYEKTVVSEPRRSQANPGDVTESELNGGVTRLCLEGRYRFKGEGLLRQSKVSVVSYDDPFPPMIISWRLNPSLGCMFDCLQQHNSSPVDSRRDSCCVAGDNGQRHSITKWFFMSKNQFSESF